MKSIRFHFSEETVSVSRKYS